MTYRFTRIWARVQIVIGYALIALALLAPIYALIGPIPGDDPWTRDLRSRGLLGGSILVAGLAAGIPLVILGQLLLAFLSLRRILLALLSELRAARAEHAPAQPTFGQRLGRRRAPP
jgi:hypothetical protein